MHEHDDERDRMLDGWQAAAPGWGRQADSTRAASMPVSRWMIDAAALTPGLTVVELAAGPGDTGFLAAEQIAPGGTLICSDAVEAMIEIARDRAQEQGVTNVEFKQLQLEWIDLPTASADVILIKWALMLLLDPIAAAQECRRVLRPAGRMVVAVWDTPDTNPWVTLPQMAMSDLGHIQSTPSAGPGMFALSAPGALQSVLTEAAFFDTRVEAIEMSRSYRSLTAWLGETVDLSSRFREAWNPLDDQQRLAVRERLEQLAQPFVAADGSVTVPGRCLGALAEA